jgi:hypothetical protein
MRRKLQKSSESDKEKITNFTDETVTIQKIS